LNKHEEAPRIPSNNPQHQPADTAHIVLSFDDNKHAGILFGKFDEHLALIEQKLGIEAVARGNQVDLRGEAMMVNRAEATLQQLYEKLQSGETVEAGDVDGAIRMSQIPSSDRDEKNSEPGVSRRSASKSRRNPASIGTFKKTVNARTPMQEVYIRAMSNCELVFGIGPAGTGKTYLAVAYAASLLEQGAIDRIILTRPAVEAGERLGFLPGDMKEKVDPYLRPLYDALYDMMPGDKVERAIANGVIEIAPLAFMRGRTLANSAIILDEAQNTTAMQMKMFLTRLGENSCMTVTGDPSQIDLPMGQKSGLVEALDILKSVELIKQVRFTSADVVRHPLVAKIVEAYDSSQSRSAAHS
jgi:phosphate starvation-inducible PhoH-like protein